MTQFGNFIEPKQKKADRDAANEQTAYLRENQPQPRQNENNPRDYDQNKVENGSGYNVDPFAVLRIHNATWPERTDRKFTNEAMRNGVESLGVKPSDEWNMVSVLQKSAPDSSFAQGVCSGPTAVFVLYRTRESLSYPYAIPIPEDSGKLVASPYGLNRILWHSEPSEDFEECVGEVLQTYISMGEDGQWCYWKLEDDLPCCGSVTAKLCDNCGNVLQPDCPIIRTIYAPKGLNLCGCEDSCATWSKDSVVPAWWYQYLNKWVTIPNTQAGFEEQEIEVVTGLQVTGGVITPSQDYVAVVTDVIVDTDKISLCDTVPEQLYCLGGDITLSATASGPVTVTGNLGTSENPVRLDVISACDKVLISGASLSTEDDVTLAGTLSGTAPVTVGLSGVEFDVTGTCAGAATGNVNVSGTCSIYNATLPKLNVTGQVVKTSAMEPVTLSGGTAKRFLTGAVLTKPTLTLTPTSLTIPATTGSVSGTLGAISLSGLTVTLDLSDIFDTETVVKDDSFEFTGCTLSWDTVEAVVLKPGADLSNVTATLSGTIAAGTSFSGNADLRTGATPVTINNPSGWNAGGLATTDDTVTVPTSAVLDTQKLGVTGKAEWPQDTAIGGLVSTSGSATLAVAGTITGTATGDSGDTATGTATLNTPVSVSGPLDIESGVRIEGTLNRDCPQYAIANGIPITLSTTTDVTIPVTGTISDTRECYVDMPTTICLENGAIDVRHGRFPLPSVDLTGATISGVTSTIKVLGCKECPEPEEEEEPNA